MIKDSGDRTSFDTGAVRDMRKGKGRCDLMPLDIVCVLDKSETLNHIRLFQKYDYAGELYKALEFYSKEAFGGMETMLLEVAVHFEEGAEKYGENNWQKGIPEWCYLDSAVRHYIKWKRGDDDERHDRAFAWNIICLIWTVERRKEVK